MKKIYLSIYKFHTEDDARERNMVEIWKMLVARQSHLFYVLSRFYSIYMETSLTDGEVAQI